jgi:hypothetical protein
MSTAEETRTAVREHPFLYEALRAGVVNYTEAAAFLDVGEQEAVAVALRRYEDELSERVADTEPDGSVQVRMERGLGRADEATGPIVVGDATFAPDEGSLTGIVATGALSPVALREVLGRCETADITVEAAGVSDEALVLVVGRRDGASALRVVEAVAQA